MKTRTETVRVGELLGSIDWSYDFASHDWDHGGAMNPTCLQRNMEMLRELDDGIERGEAWEATTDGGWPRVGWGPVVSIGMYDGWPYWKPTPSMYIGGPFGGSWCSVFLLSDIRRAP